MAAVIGGSLGGVAGFDLVQRRQTIFRNFPIIGHLRFIHEGVGPQQVDTADITEELTPFVTSRRLSIGEGVG
ncbi:MAG TPA: hypothetical protein VEF72_04595 [Mycobacterium sp.]|nr:hypothetical protein [Mycobacterium sp.]